MRWNEIELGERGILAISVLAVAEHLAAGIVFSFDRPVTLASPSPRHLAVVVLPRSATVALVAAARALESLTADYRSRLTPHFLAQSESSPGSAPDAKKS